MKIFLPPADANTGTLDLIEPASNKKMNIAAANSELATVKTADRTGPNHSDAKRLRHKRDKLARFFLAESRLLHAGGRVSAWKFRVINRAPLLKVR